MRSVVYIKIFQNVSFIKEEDRTIRSSAGDVVAQIFNVHVYSSIAGMKPSIGERYACGGGIFQLARLSVAMNAHTQIDPADFVRPLYLAVPC